MSKFKFSKRSKQRLIGVDSSLITLFENVLSVSPIDGGIPEDGGLRTATRQMQLFENGVSRCDGIKNLSAHQKGKAIDIYAYVNGQASWCSHHLNLIAGVVYSEAAKMGLKIRWGGTFGDNGSDFNGWDKGHFEII